MVQAVAGSCEWYKVRGLKLCIIAIFDLYVAILIRGYILILRMHVS